VLRGMPPNVSSDLVSNFMSQTRLCSQHSGLFSNGVSAGSTEVTELPTTTSVIHLMEGISDQSILRSHSDPHMQHAIPSLHRSTSACSSNHQFSSNHHRSDSQSSINTHNQAPSFLGNLNPTINSHGVKKGPIGGPPGQHSSSGSRRPMRRSIGEAPGLHRVHMRPATPPIDIQDPPVASSSASGEHNGVQHTQCCSLQNLTIPTHGTITAFGDMEYRRSM
jgi:hypothetical protein